MNTALETRKALQRLLGVTDDGDIGMVTRAVLDRLARTSEDVPWPPPPEEKLILKGTVGWKFTARVDGDDIVVDNCRATCFGGSDDPQDSGETASGISTKKNPRIEAVALPMSMSGQHVPASVHDALDGSPIPKVPWKTIVEVTCGDKTHAFPVIDLGPHRRVGNALDLTIAAAKLFNPKATATNFEMTCSYRIKGGARYITA